MTQHSLRTLLSGLATLTNDCEISHITNDTRAVKFGSLLLACPGFTTDARDLIPDAIIKGAAAVAYQTYSDNRELKFATDIPIIAIKDLIKFQSIIAARFYDEPTKDLTVVGVTGTNGKTSCTQFIAQVLQQDHQKCAVIGTLGFGFLPNLNTSLYTTPDAIVLQENLAELKLQGAQSIALEVSSHSLVQHRVDGVNFNIAVFTQLSRDHLDYHGDMQNYARAKELLFQMPGLQYGIINLDDALGIEIAKKYKNKMQMIGYSLQQKNKSDNAIVAERIRPTATGFEIKVTTPWGDGEFKTTLLGRFNISNLLAVLGVLGAMNIPLNKILNYLPNLSTVSGRMQLLTAKNQPQVVVDYSHTPDALQKALQALREHCSGNLWCVFGCGGDRDRGKRPQMAAIAEMYSDKVIVTNDNPRTEAPEKIAADIVAGFQQRQAVTTELDRAAAIKFAVQNAGVNDMVLVAGKGHETKQIIGEKRIPFSDIEEVKKWLE